MTEQAKKETSPLVYKKAIAVMADMEALGKDRRNNAQGYNFRGIDDVYNMVQPIMAKHGLIMFSTILDERSEERASKGGGVLIYRILRLQYSLMAEDGSCIHTQVTGEGMDSGDKAMNKAMSVAQKYALLQMFMIPTEEAKDPENDSPSPAPKQAPPKDKGKDKPKADPAARADLPAHDPKVPMTDAQAQEILDLVAAFQIMSSTTDEKMAEAIKNATKKDYGVEITGIKDLSSGMATHLIATLKKWGELWKTKHPEAKS